MNNLTWIARVMEERTENVSGCCRGLTHLECRVETPCGVAHAVQGLVQTFVWLAGVLNVDIRSIQGTMINIHLCALIKGISAEMPHWCWSRRIDEQGLLVREREGDEERAKRQRTEKKTELEVSSVASACELRPRVILTRCTKWTQLESTWNLCQAQRTHGLGFVCGFVGNIADDPMTKNIQNTQGVMTRSSVEVCRAHQYQSSRMLTTSTAVCREP